MIIRIVVNLKAVDVQAVLIVLHVRIAAVVNIVALVEPVEYVLVPLLTKKLIIYLRDSEIVRHQRPVLNVRL